MNQARSSRVSHSASAAPVTPARQTAFQLFVPVIHQSLSRLPSSMSRYGPTTKWRTVSRMIFRVSGASLEPNK
ncbi:MAG: hypothetical protein BWZ10_02906 [candidate division BRC1 bacterium ADurb.BinA364]|nr:MAG: hypothetical protein BWZ10_02906 [candidate division BRC1 bacterium ADurb.BinA364]